MLACHQSSLCLHGCVSEIISLGFFDGIVADLTSAVCSKRFIKLLSFCTFIEFEFYLTPPVLLPPISANRHFPFKFESSNTSRRVPRVLACIKEFLVAKNMSSVNIYQMYFWLSPKSLN
jgi:hypothetical protein